MNTQYKYIMKNETHITSFLKKNYLEIFLLKLINLLKFNEIFIIISVLILKEQIIHKIHIY